MPTLDRRLLAWVVRVAAPGAEVSEVRGLRDGGSPWLVRLDDPGGERDVVLRVDTGQGPAALRTEVAALRLATEHGLPVPRLVAAELAADPALLLVERLPGSSAIPRRRPRERLAALGRAAAALHAVPLAPSAELPRRDRPIAGTDFAALRRRQPARPLLEEAERRTAQPPPADADVFVHGDLWQGNALWTGDRLAGLIDWDFAGAGPPGVDLGSLRCDAALCFGVAAAEDVLAGWEEAAGRAARDVAYWDVVGALSTPPDVGWFQQAIAGQGRTDLTREILLRRRDQFLAAALDRLG